MKRWLTLKLAALIAVTFFVLATAVFSLAPVVGSPFVALATVFTNAGKAIVTNRVVGAGTEPTFVGWGTGAGTAAITDTTLFTEASESRVSATSTRVTTTVTNDTNQWVATITANAGKTITNAANFDASTAGNICVKGDFTGIALNTGDAIQFTIKLQFT
jgi:hypothetical protein